MSADDWQGCPKCCKTARDYLAYAKDKLPYDTVRALEEKYEFIEDLKSGEWRGDWSIVPYVGKDEFLEEINDWAEQGIETSHPVRVDFDYGTQCDGTYYVNFSASCTECGHEYTEGVER